MISRIDKDNINSIFKEVPVEYRPIPFWSWNEKLNTDETKRQVDMMHDAGIGGFFMHARGGLQTEYMGEEWFDNVQAAVEAAEKNGMRPWAYDENGWPSGVADGTVSRLGVDYQLKYLRMEKEFSHKETAICKCGDYWFYYDINPFYIDALDEKVVKVFIENAYEKYYEKFGNRIEGFFTDEPEISRKGFPWSFVFEEEYKKRYNENILEHLDELFLEIKDYKNTRLKFWKMVTDLFSSAFMKQIYDWCDERGLKFTGHILCEDTLESQLTCNGACMPHYEYFHIPGMDWLGRNIWNNLTARQLSSVAAQTGKDAILSETFALCGHSVSFDELKGIYEWQMVRGVNLLCQHLEGYSIRGIRKRDCPPAMYYQQPWWDNYHRFNEAVSRVGMILKDGKEETDILVLHPMSTAWTLYNAGDVKPIDELHDKFMAVIEKLEKKHIEFHLGDETIMERHGRVENGSIVIGDYSYKKFILPPHDILFPSTKALIDEFKASGGEVVTADEIAENPVIDNENITYTSRTFEGARVHYFVNSTPESQDSTLGVEGKRLDIYSGEVCECVKNHTFEPWGSLVIIEDGTRLKEKDKAEVDYIYPDGKFKICGEVENVLLLDKCDYYFDGQLQDENAYVLNAIERANKLEMKMNIQLDYHIKMCYDSPNEIYLVSETPEIFKIQVNGKEIDKADCGYYVDSSFRKIEISKYLEVGENIISFNCIYEQSDEFYKNLKDAYVFADVRNKLKYDMEIEAAYLVGNFSVRTDGEWKALDKNAKRYIGEFVIDKPKTEIELRDIQMQGFPFFCGTLEVSKEVEIGKNTILKTNRKGINVVSAEINGNETVMLTGNGEINLSNLAEEGKHTLKLSLTNNLRNLLGPHHLERGESWHVVPDCFYKEDCLWNSNEWHEREIWNENYCFIDTGIY